MYSLDELKEIIALLEEHNLTTIKMSDKTNSVCIEKAPATVQPIATPVTTPLANANFFRKFFLKMIPKDIFFIVIWQVVCYDI